MAAIFKPAANIVSGCSVHCSYVRLCDRTGDSCTGNAVYTDRKRDHAGAYSDRRTGRDRLYVGILSAAGKKDQFQGKADDQSVLRTGYDVRDGEVYHPGPERDVYGGGDRCRLLFHPVCTGLWCGKRHRIWDLPFSVCIL